MSLPSLDKGQLIELGRDFAAGVRYAVKYAAVVSLAAAVVAIPSLAAWLIWDQDANDAIGITVVFWLGVLVLIVLLGAIYLKGRTVRRRT